MGNEDRDASRHPGPGRSRGRPANARSARPRPTPAPGPPPSDDRAVGARAGGAGRRRCSAGAVRRHPVCPRRLGTRAPGGLCGRRAAWTADGGAGQGPRAGAHPGGAPVRPVGRPGPARDRGPPVAGRGPDRARAAGEAGPGPPARPTAGDFAPVNVILRDGDPVALLDLERARLAHPLFDAAWWRWILRHHHPERWAAAGPAFLFAAGLDDGPRTAARLDLMAALQCLEMLHRSPARPAAARRAWRARLLSVLAWAGDRGT